MSTKREDDRGSAETVPVCVQDLRHDTAEDRARFAADQMRRRGARSQGLIGDGDFMEVSRRVSIAATVTGALLILVGVRAPLLEALRTIPGLMETIGEMSSDGVAALRPTASEVLTRTRALKDKDERGIALARRELACLDGAGPCPAGTSPLR